MMPLPDWAPNLHPLVVHFPIALLVVAPLVDLSGLIWSRETFPRRAATLLYALGAVGLIVAYLSGREAAATIWLPGMSHSVVGEHWTWAFRTLWFYGALLAVRLIVLRGWRRTPSWVVAALFVVAGLAGVGLLVRTGDRGGALVYQYGVGTDRTP